MPLAKRYCALHFRIQGANAHLNLQSLVDELGDEELRFYTGSAYPTFAGYGFS